VIIILSSSLINVRSMTEQISEKEKALQAAQQQAKDTLERSSLSKSKSSRDAGGDLDKSASSRKLSRAPSSRDVKVVGDNPMSPRGERHRYEVAMHVMRYILIVLFYSIILCSPPLNFSDKDRESIMQRSDRYKNCFNSLLGAHSLASEIKIEIA
jgi:hypothetical protein